MENKPTSEELRSIKDPQRRELLKRAHMNRLRKNCRRKVQEINIVNLDSKNATETDMMPGIITWDRSWEDPSTKFFFPLGE